MKNKSLLTLLLISIFILSACGNGPTENSESPVETTRPEQDPPPTDGYDYSYYCDTERWLDTRDDIRQGFEVSFEQVSTTKDGNLAVQTVLASLESIQINDRIVYVDSWNVLQDRGEEAVQEINPEPWILRANEILNRLPSPDILMTIHFEWIDYWGDGSRYEWQMIDGQPVTCDLAS